MFIKCRVAIDNFTANINESALAILARVNWLYVRLLFITIGVAPQFFVTSDAVPETLSLTWQFLPVVLLFSIVGLLFIIGLQAFNPMSAKVWLPPAWKHNPFDLKQPLQFFHFGGWFTLVGSLPSFLFALMSEGNKEGMLIAAMQASFGLGILIGLRLSALIYHRKFTNA
ncbi:hypothetical protein [Pseudoalteromonas obscura]|uniref:Transmembrane protein n=1 Tax=Pseudoalteromonas obscura TaxID=3048491 RepID=A0ABT7ETE0_9GAMM|nr:hypothetical protein [Pseudoalteromonas sp. P94(2023)]MDK2598330.1 hypothetical protein [Pseudoalteromonas sp. P94(2023)]